MERLKSKESVKIIIMLAIVIGGTIGFVFGLRVALRIEYPLMVVVSESMVPTLNVGDIIVVQGSLNACEIKASTSEGGVGDMIVFREPGTLNIFVVHRAIDKISMGNTWYFKTQGDNNPYPDLWNVPENNLIGKVIGRIPLFGYLFLFLRTPLGLIMFIILILIFLFQEYFSNGKKEKFAETKTWRKL